MSCYLIVLFCFFFKQKTAYDVRISDWSSDVCSSDLRIHGWRLLEADLYVDGQERDYEALVIEATLDDGARLIVGRDVEDIDDRDELFTIGSAWLILIAALLAVGGSVAMSRAVGRRIDAVTRTARQEIGRAHV